MDNKSIKRKFIGNTSWMMGQKIYSMLVSLVVGSLSARYLGPSNYGLLSYGTAIISFFTTISALGLDGIIVAEMIKSPNKSGTYLGTAIFMRFIVSLISFACIYFIVLIIEPGNTLLQTVTMLQSISVLLNTYEVLNYWFQMQLDMKFVSIATMAGLTATGIWRIYLLATGASVEFFALSTSVSALVCGTVVIICFFVREHPSLSVNFNDGKMLLSKSYHLIISSLAITLYSQMDRIMLGKITDSQVVGIYSAAMTIAIMWEFVPQAIVNSARPILLEKRNTSYEQYIHYFQILLLSISLLGIFVSIFMMIFGKLILYILYGEAYLEAASILCILIWSTGFSMIGTARSIWIVAEDKNKYAKYYVFIGAGVNLVLNAVLIPIYGAVGAAIATLISQISVAIINPLFFSETRVFFGLYLQSFTKFKYLYNMMMGSIKRGKNG